MLQELVRYAQKTPGLDPEPGFTSRTVRWLAELSLDGQLVNVLPLGDDKGEQTPKCPAMDKMNAGGRAHFLVETLQTITLLCKPNEDPKKVAGSRKKQTYFKEMVRQASVAAMAIQPLAQFLNDVEQVEELRARLSAEKAKPTDWLRWRIAGTNPLQQAEVLDWWRKWRETDLAKGKPQEKLKSGKPERQDLRDAVSAGMVCFLTGEVLDPLSTQPKITGLSGVGGLGMGDVMVGFDKAAFCSFGLEQSSNAAMGENSTRMYVDALNYLIKDKNHSRKMAKALVVHWFKEAVKPEDDPLTFLFEPPEQTEAAAQSTARKILDSLRTGERPIPANNRYFAMTVSGAAGRVMVRDWMEGSFEELVARIEQWFSDLEIVARNGGKLAPDQKFMAVCGAIVRDLKDFPAPTATTLWRVVLAGLPIPQPLIAQALARFRTDLIDDKPFNHARMGLIKAYFIRKGGNHGMNAYLNKEHPEPAYHCGRLLAMLASLQRAALGDVGAGVVQRYYVAASQMPGLTLGRLFGNAKNHLNKLDGGLAFWYEDQLAEIMSRIQDRIPATLNLERQSLFALGYYQQIAANRAGKNNTNESSKGDQQ
ncbi:MAG: type I-C CRISPR-associated protein Cas8c/Csd1 [Deltaproteobacteria bacterium]